MAEMTVVVHMLFEGGKTDEAIVGLAASVEASHEEPGCLLAALHRDIDHPDVLVLVERWTSKDAHDAHLKTAHVQKLAETVTPLIAGVPRISLSESIEVGDPSMGML